MISEKDILFEDNHLIVVNKKPGEIVQGDKTGDVPLLEMVKEYLVKKYNKPGLAFLGTVHRLDRPVSGAVVFAKTSKSLARMNLLFAEKNIKKTYWAIVGKMPPESNARLVHYLTRNEQKNMSTAHIKEVKDSKKAELEYSLLSTSDKYCLLEVNLFTGRHHQIRVQLAAIGCPIRGDLKYGYPRSNPDGSVSLHAREIEFEHPVTKHKIKITAKPPADVLWDFFVKSVG